MLGDVGDRLDDDAVGGDLDGSGEHRHVGETTGGGVEAGGRAQSELIECRGSQPFDYPPYIGDSSANVCGEVLELTAGRLLLGRQERLGGLRLQGEPGEGRTEAVVEVAAQSTSFFLAGQHEP